MFLSFWIFIIQGSFINVASLLCNFPFFILQKYTTTKELHVFYKKNASSYSGQNFFQRAQFPLKQVEEKVSLSSISILVQYANFESKTILSNCWLLQGVGRETVLSLKQDSTLTVQYYNNVCFQSANSKRILIWWLSIIYFKRVLMFSLLYCLKQIDSMLPCICSGVYHRRCQNVVRTSVTHEPLLFCSYLILMSSAIISLLSKMHSNMESIC